MCASLTGEEEEDAVRDDLKGTDAARPHFKTSLDNKITADTRNVKKNDVFLN